MGAHQNPLQRAVVLITAMVGAGLYRTLDALVGMTVHIPFLLPGLDGLSMTALPETILVKYSNLAFFSRI